ncbi:MAG TPA: hypothetical protein VK474_04905 [Chthoniobacterales bacterium]|nr:hypothetical protein [Chthoniobacterales bacterium]
MKICACAAAIILLGLARSAEARRPDQADDFRQLTKVEPLPVALDRDFQFRKTKLFVLGNLAGRKKSPGAAYTASRSPAVGAEAAFRLFGAVTELDKRRRSGHYFDFFWRAKRAAPVTVRLEYQQDLLRSLTQAREVNYPNGKGSHKTEFAVIGDDFINDGRIIAWRCLLIVNGRIVAEDRSYLWR